MKDDYISRQAAIDTVMEFMPKLSTPDGSGPFDREIFEAQEMFVDIGQALNALPPAQPENKELSAWKEDYIRMLNLPRDDYNGIMGYINEVSSAQPEIIRCNSCKYWAQSTGKMKGYGLGRCDFHDAQLVTCNGFCYWAERREE